MLTPASREWRPRSVALIARASRAAGASRTAEPAAPSAGPATCCSNLVLPRTARGLPSSPRWWCTWPARRGGCNVTTPRSRLSKIRRRKHWKILLHRR
ncbi:uncharacterized protein LOC8050444 isoform X3 [Ixodes scapularis]|uniref:uncharacterized protein LOC8050444 isoform X3 n=1 Tax=Ixodes scapularis TaxID=6945 RepID=UPI001A9E1066|nr:uncharacterized protein LOC8050444 isoform X3 [Ixodes scapularis]